MQQIVEQSVKQKNSEIQYILGSVDELIQGKALSPFSDIVIGFLGSLSAELLSDQRNRNFPDVITFAYWCRKANLSRLKDTYKNDAVRLGLGVVFHIAPSNVPVNFAFSYVFSLLAGNSNIVRLPSKEFDQVELIINAINKVVAQPEYLSIKGKSVFVKYKQSDSLTSYFSSLCDARIIWGGDSTVQHIRSISIPPRAIDIAFADRFSLCIIDTEYLANISIDKLRKICDGFYNDTYLMDQNACSSPQVVIWKHVPNSEYAERCMMAFWSTLADIANERYGIQPVQGIDKLTRAFRDSIDKSDSLTRISNFNGSVLMKATLKSLKDSNDKYKASFGYFYEYVTDDLNEIKSLADKKVQTITYIGDIKAEVASIIVNNGLKGIDRVVPVGSALDIDILWDGFDLIRTLSRVINIK